MEIKTVSLIGLGAMGVFFAPKLEACLGHEQFRVIAGGSRKERLERQGVTLNGKNYRFNIVDPMEPVSPADLIILAVKDMQLDQAIKDIRNHIGPNSQIMCVMNGVDSENRLAEVYGWDKVVYSYMRMSIVMDQGVANFDPEWGKVHFGEAQNQEISLRVKNIQTLFDHASIRYSIDEDMIKGMWFKYMCNIGENLTCALLGVPFGAFHVSDYANHIRKAAMNEVLAIAQKKGIKLGQAELDAQEVTIKRIPFTNKPSTLQDLEKGRVTEIEMFAGRVIEMGKEYGVPTPIAIFLYNGIHVLEEKNLGRFVR